MTRVKKGPGFAPRNLSVSALTPREIPHFVRNDRMFGSSIEPTHAARGRVRKLRAAAGH